MVCSWERGRKPKQKSGLLCVCLHSVVWKSICWNRALKKTKESESASTHVNTFCFKFLCWFVFNVQLDFVVCLFSNWLLSEWSACWQGETFSSWRLRPTDRKWDRDKPEAMTVPGGVVCSCLCVCERACVCVCVVPLRLATEGRMEVLLIISPEASHLRPTLKIPQTHTHATKGDAILGTWAECWGLAASGLPMALCDVSVSVWSLFFFLGSFNLKRSSEVRGSSQVWMTERESLGHDEMIKNLMKWAGMKIKRHANRTINNVWNVRRRETEIKIKGDGGCQKISQEKERYKAERQQEEE